MFREMLTNKVHRATVTEADLNYEGSLSLCTELMQASGIISGQKVDVVNINNGARFQTYIIDGTKGQCCLNGAAARLGEVGDKVIIMGYSLLSDAEVQNYKPKRVLVDATNNIVAVKDSII